MKLKGKVALVTGAARGLGRAYARHLASLGAAVAVNDINLEAAREYGEELTAETVMDEVRKCGVPSLGIRADVSDKAQVEAMVEEILSEFGRLDILVNNAGGHLRPGERSFASSMPEEDLRYILDLNLLGTIYCSQAASRPMIRQRSGKIVNVSSQAGLHARAPDGGRGAHYAVAKAAVVHYTRLLAAELGPYGINVNCIAPGWILSSRAIAQGRAEPERRQALESQIALRRLGEPADCAKVVEFLATDLSDYVTGQCIPVCGGFCLF